MIQQAGRHRLSERELHEYVAEVEGHDSQVTAVIVVPNDWTMSAGRLLLAKFPIWYPDHLTVTTPGRMRRWLREGFRIVEGFCLPFRYLPFAVNLYYFVVAEKAPAEAPR